jgi:hypothetical protein
MAISNKNPDKNPAVAILALMLGFFGLALVFSDLGANERWLARVVVATLFFFLCGLGIGFLNPELWITAGLSAWGGILMGGFIVLMAIGRYGSAAFDAQEPPYISAGLTMLFIPLGLTLIGGYIGKLLSQMRKQQI